MPETKTRVMVLLVDKRFERLPVAYAEFLELKSEGLDDAEIANILGVPVESLPLLARLANAKLTRLARDHEDGTPTSG